jgi:transcriptional regulator with GAF, ATPase, and Fis domain
MERVQQLLLDVWREACRHIEIGESIKSIANRVAKHLPLQQLVVCHFESEALVLSSFVAHPDERTSPANTNRRRLSASEGDRLKRWARSGRPLRGRRGRPSPLELIDGLETNGDIIAVSLSNKSKLEGVLLVVAKNGRTFSDSNEQMVLALREPISVALANDHQLRELAALRMAAEADRGALLRRLGRTDLNDTIVGEESGFKHVMERIQLVAHSDVPVLILGETGTGKELVARALHSRGSRQHGPFIRVNCGAIPGELIDSQLFGHEKGSFTGADQSRQGWLERADQGTLFLDEIGELPPVAQVRFLRVLQDGFIERVGGHRPIHVDVRVIAATHRDLAMMVRDGKFREDLWYRMAVFPILLPPLRDRPEDISALAEHFSQRAAARFALPVVRPTRPDICLLQSYNWPGNIRELAAVIDRAAILGNGQQLEIGKALGSLGEHRLNRTKIEHRTSSPETLQPSDELTSLDDAMRRHIELVLAKTNGRIEGRHGAAAVLKINPHTLRARMRKLRIDWSRFRDEHEV